MDLDLFLHGILIADCRSKCDDSAIFMMFVMIVVYLHIFMEKCDGDTTYHNSTLMIDNVCKISLLSVLWTVLVNGKIYCVLQGLGALNSWSGRWMLDDVCKSDVWPVGCFCVHACGASYATQLPVPIKYHHKHSGQFRVSILSILRQSETPAWGHGKTRLREIQARRPVCIHTFAGPQPWTTLLSRKDWTGEISRAQKNYPWDNATWKIMTIHEIVLLYRVKARQVIRK